MRRLHHYLSRFLHAMIGILTSYFDRQGLPEERTMPISTEGMSLLEMLRQELVVVTPTTKMEAIQKFNLIKKHLGEFPPKLQGIIRYILKTFSESETTAETDLWAIYLVVKEFFLGKDIWESIIAKSLLLQNPTTEEAASQELDLIIEYRDCFPSELQETISIMEDESSMIVFSTIQAAIKDYLSKKATWGEWYGLDKDVDTHDQAEVVIRLFPTVLYELRDNLSPTCFLMTSSKAVSFVPLFLKLGSREFQDSGVQPIVNRVPYNFSEVYLQQIIAGLLCNNSWNRDGNKENSAELDKESLQALKHCREIGLVQRGEMFCMLDYLFVFWNAKEYYFDDYRSEDDVEFVGEFFQKRFKLVLDWGPFLLESYMLKDGFWVCLSNIHENSNEKVIDPVIRTACQVSLSHYPKELGFMFSQQYVHDSLRPNMRMRRELAQQKIFKIGREEITKAMRQNKVPIKEWVRAVASNEKIPPDGLYALIRSDPIGAIIPDS